MTDTQAGQLHTELSTAVLDAVVGGTLFEVADYSFDIEQVLNIGSQSSGRGPAK
jgi:hypothetical protein